jgi:hypothetical protein
MTAQDTDALTDRLESEIREVERAYAPEGGHPLRGYAALLSTYGTSVLLLSLLVRRRRALPERIGAADLALLCVGAHKLSRLVTKDAVTGVIRAPFTTFQEPAGAGEVNETVRDDGTVRHAVGELVSCPFCMSVWAATALTFGLLLAPRATRAVLAVLASVTASDYLQFAYSAVRRAEERMGEEG